MNSSHWLRAFATLLVTCTVIFLWSGQAYAECKGHGKHKGHQMPSYAELDANADDTVTSEEFYAFRAKRMSERAAEGRKLKNAKNADVADVPIVEWKPIEEETDQDNQYGPALRHPPILEL